MARCFRAHGWDVLGFGRRSVTYAQRVPYQLGDDPWSLPWGEVDALVHCAYDFRPKSPGKIHEINVDGSIGLLRAAREAGVKRAVFISSLSSFPGCRSLYGQAKLEVEAAALELGWAVVRPGLVWSNTSGSLMRSLERAASGRFIPLIGDGSYIQYLVFDEDLAELVFALCQSDAPSISHAISAAHPEKISLRSLLQRMADKQGNRPTFVPIPWRLMHAGLKALETLGLPAPFRSDSLIGIVFQNPAPEFALPELPQVTFRPFA
ncbi:NAD-dependent epimerase/dehydratase [Chthoniobacter flavus Ellin428]|uniref:NAD-dependent epimerase/dehydratase n=2 Tax=Chthoniobacter flavus TaxID=191863 RepID=B4D554_9BACT|nr:NAD-dependent epimerase/dehydratase [Chthoniobacter flavus Ellin428]TCO91289.1 nucleoside-diphosphate-sugar epimerase [Chthoniobacter flavus]